MGFFSGAGKVVKVISKGAWKVGTKSVKFAGKTAGKSTLWVVKKAAVDPTKNKILDWSLVKNAGKVREAIGRGECGNCGKKKVGNKADFCSAKCSMEAYESWSDVRPERINVHAKPKDQDPLNLYFECGCNKKSMTHNGCDQYGYMEI